MKLKIWQEEGNRHTSLDGVEIGDIITGLELYNRPHKPTEVYLQIVADVIDVEVEAEVYIEFDGRKYRLKEQ